VSLVEDIHRQNRVTISHIRAALGQKPDGHTRTKGAMPTEDEEIEITRRVLAAQDRAVEALADDDTRQAAWRAHRGARGAGLDVACRSA
jgi:hypothetical protein